ncbi:MAG: Tm-1-like ATP-binding domain-containing protein [Pirellulales bacterium]|jgi:uncharacterized protein (UPF0261 family)
MPTIAVLGCLDTKGHEHAFVAEIIRSLGHTPLLIDTGTTDCPQVDAAVRVTEILPTFSTPGDRGACVSEVAAAVGPFVRRLASAGQLDGIISLGGGGGTSIGTAAMRALPLGIPKVMVSTLASGNTAPYVGTSDLVMVPAIVDVAGLNRLSRSIFTAAAHAVCGMVNARQAASQPATADKPLIVASMFGNTTDCVNVAKADLEAAGYEVLVFHATGTGGRTMESLIASGMVAGVLDITTTEVADELCGGILSAGPSRLEAAGIARVPTIVVPGCVDMVNFGPRESMPAELLSRTLYQHNDQITLMRTTPEENQKIAEFLAAKLNVYPLPPTVLLPLKGVSIISAAGGAFHDEDADRVLFATLQDRLAPHVRVVASDHAVNDPAFAHRCADELLRLLEAQQPQDETRSAL